MTLIASDGGLTSPATQFLRGHVPVQDGHLHVHQDHVERPLFSQIERNLAVLGDTTSAPRPRYEPYELAVGFAVFHQEDRCAGE